MGESRSYVASSRINDGNTVCNTVENDNGDDFVRPGLFDDEMVPAEMDGEADGEEGEEERDNDEEFPSDTAVDDDAITDTRSQEPSLPSASVEIQNLAVKSTPRPDASSELFALRMPHALHFESSPFSAKNERRKQIARTQQRQQRGSSEKDGQPPLESCCIRWRFKRTADGGLERDDSGELIRESNTHVIQWTDGSYTLSVGDEQLECQIARDKTFLFEESDTSVQMLHAFLSRRMVCRPFGLQCSTTASARGALVVPRQLRGNRGGARSAGRGTRLTTASDALKTNREGLRRLEESRERHNIKKRQKEASKAKGLTARFLESDEGSSGVDERKQHKRRR